MNQKRFEHLMTKARTFHDLGDRPDYWQGYQRGRRRLFHGEAFGTIEEHQRWLALGEDETRQELGQGYRDGFEERNRNKI